ncbi:alkane 1-monooxygenase [Celeribacter indicus]|uniref:Alkane 1-monooxygenase n=1 Tax=Celeribacter indicus TaxID=1208324 RepID=A0A0B5DWK9_9RHOB|nr:alkane 1-monooxygenase [Celeribacter indicus]AJE45101.1 alkane 1-monooxygenase [Celeribacter indicus]SDX27442.1 alkane 1-monooxygenase [Celeribacter indicus]
MNVAEIRTRNALPFWLSLGVVPLLWFGAVHGGWATIIVPLYAWYMFSALDAVLGLNTGNPDPETEEDRLFWYKLVTLIWFPVQAANIFGLIWFVTHGDHLSWPETIVLFFGLGVSSGTIGIVYAHELLHQRNPFERWLGDLLLASVLYSHFRTEHLLVHHRHVGTRRDAVTALYNEGFHRYFLRVLRECPRSAWEAEKAMLARRGLSPWHPRNPHFRYWTLQILMLLLAVLIGGVPGLLLFAWQAFVAIWQLELTNYVEHYGLTRRHLGGGRYEHVKPHHSWNAAHAATNWLLINLQRHSDHHYKPDRRFPLLQTYDACEAPQLPYGYPLMTMAAMVPPLWRKIMNPKVKSWRRQFYPDMSEFEDWEPYKRGTLPLPRS